MKNQIKFLFVNKKYKLYITNKSFLLADPSLESLQIKQGIWIPNVLTEHSKYPNQMLIKIYVNNVYTIINYSDGNRQIIRQISGQELINEYEELKVKNKSKFNQDTTVSREWTEVVTPEWLKKKH